jgi:hypothetical protein
VGDFFFLFNGEFGDMALAARFSPEESLVGLAGRVVRLAVDPQRLAELCGVPGRAAIVWGRGGEFVEVTSSGRTPAW